MDWNAELDVFKFKIQLRKIRYNRREILSEFARVYDPLGFIAPVKLVAGIILQDSWQADQDWDSDFPQEMIDRWTKWYENLITLEQLWIPRSFKPSDEEIINAQLHVFCDASEKGFGAVAYLRTETASGVHVGFVAVKAHVSPKKILTIPKLELQGSIIAVRLANMIKKELRIKLEEIVFWTESSCVLSWINDKRFRFKQFVENRVAEILEESKPKQWRHVPGRDNPADYASRGLQPEELNSDHTWFTGPAFLRQNKDQWPVLPCPAELREDDPEIRDGPKLIVSSVVTSTPSKSSLDTVLERTNHPYLATRIVAQMRRWLHNHRVKRDHANLTPSGIRTVWIRPTEARETMNILTKHSQNTQFATEIQALSAGRCIPANSKLKHVASFMDPEGVLRVGGRIGNGPFPNNVRYPVILPDSRLCEMLVSEFHLNLAHSSPERTLADYQVRYWSLGARRIAKRVVARCPVYVKRRAKPSVPVMAALPAVRLKAGQPPFSGTGLDFFGPVYVNVERSVCKRWGCLFTCLVTRAVHLEITHSMDASSFISALRRFIARRGSPNIIYSDNGTNLTAGEKELVYC